MPQERARENIARLVESIEESELRRWVGVFSGLRHGQRNGAPKQARPQHGDAMKFSHAGGEQTNRRAF